MKKIDKFNELISKQKCHCLRRGQFLYSCLTEIDIELCGDIIRTDADPFYNDENIGRFLEVVYGSEQMQEEYDEYIAL